MKRQFTTNEVIALTGITARQLQWWDERGLVKPARQGHRRIYNWDQLVTAAVICQLRRRGFSLQGMRKVIAFLGREFGTTWQPPCAPPPSITCSPTEPVSTSVRRPGRSWTC